ncbi:mycofactocin-coupled SDR family oxidoreductase [Nocardia miyunensis]|uniref:mycofactocin-coupled SDR family oxidoreductase n=1 Tax=Nocardia miyunensis TaxID=282684 RepID=UPI000831C1BF|nr:mycofactocin-coupled SDR family oxidoreductase [Nocardia miyunensis]
MSSDERPERVALVTGAARGVGAATVRELVRRGYHVTAIDSCGTGPASSGVRYSLASQGELDAVAAKDPERILPVVCDVREPEQLRDAVAQTMSRFGRLDAAVAAAGIIAGGQPQWEAPESDVRALLEVNAMGVWNTAAATVPVMLAGPDPAGCRFVAVASAAGERGLFHLAGYAASKHAVIGIVRGLSADLVGTGMSAVAVSPGATRTEMLTATAALYDDIDDPAELAAHQGLRRVLEPEEIAATIAFCCSPEGAVLNGSVVRAEGGFGT